MSEARALKRDVRAVSLACRDPRVPWYAKLLAGLVVAYAVSPIDLIPDFIPVLGYLDDLILVPAGIALVLRLIPADVMADCRLREETLEGRPAGWGAAAVIVLLWLGAAALVGRWAWHRRR
ncbi:MAG: DUF1232 domain-containing protein [Myxococcaceae bacterium]|nr:MAG: DUF1232 domain-containing protein [Myxococcaceae bacterium]